jgi:hypothetical protein
MQGESPAFLLNDSCQVCRKPKIFMSHEKNSDCH